MALSRDDRPRLASKARLVRDRASGREMLLYPERGLALNAVAFAVTRRLDGARTVAAIAAEVAAELVDAPADAIEGDVLAFLEELAKRALIETGGGAPRDFGPASTLPGEARAPDGGPGDGRGEHPYTLIAELTYRCPLRCPYCSNPVELAAAAGELSTDEWIRVFAEAAELGVMAVHLTGGEPLARRDLEALVRGARAAGLYTNLITSGVPLARERLAALAEAGVDHVQLSVQDADAEGADRVAGYPAFAHKIAVAGWVKEAGLPLTVNVVLHRANIDRVEAIIALAERLRADRLELANTQYLGWALPNREALLPTRAQLDRAFAVASEARQRLLGRMEMVYVTPDYYAAWPRACMDGWARRYVHIAPTGLVLPCHAAHTLPGLVFESVRGRSLAAVWKDAPGLARFRGDAWMAEPCASCPRKGVDYGGCRCQAYHLTGDAAATDPACSLSPAHGIIEAARLSAGAPRPPEGPRYLYRTPPRPLRRPHEGEPVSVRGARGGGGGHVHVVAGREPRQRDRARHPPGLRRRHGRGELGARGVLAHHHRRAPADRTGRRSLRQAARLRDGLRRLRPGLGPVRARLLAGGAGRRAGAPGRGRGHAHGQRSGAHHRGVPTRAARPRARPAGDGDLHRPHPGALHRGLPGAPIGLAPDLLDQRAHRARRRAPRALRAPSPAEPRAAAFPLDQRAPPGAGARRRLDRAHARAELGVASGRDAASSSRPGRRSSPASCGSSGGAPRRWCRARCSGSR